MKKRKSKRPGCIIVGVELNLLPGQELEIKKHYGTGSLANAVTLSLQETTGLPLPDKRTRTGKKELLVFDLNNKPLFSGLPITRRQVQALLDLKSRQAITSLVKNIKQDNVAVRGGYIFRLYNHRGKEKTP
jgi:hypothetical protein